VSFTVTARNAAGPGAASAPSGAVTPRRPGRLVVLAQPATSVVYGGASTVRAAVQTLGGAGIGGQWVELRAMVRPSTTWKRVAYGTTDSGGRVTLRAVLPATSALRLYHPTGAVSAPAVPVRGVSVAIRVSAAAVSTRIRLGGKVVVRGGIAPAYPVGSPVYLQRLVAGLWRNVATGWMNTSTSYAVTWVPGGAGSYVVRVVKPADAKRARGTSPWWWQTIVKETPALVARDVLADASVTLETTHDSGVADLASARQNLYDVGAGRLAHRSAYQNAPGGYTTIDLRLLRALRRMGWAGRVTVSEVAGGSHSVGSAHYAGRGLDISWVNGQHVAPGSSFGIAVDACRAHGASRIFSPAYDPYGGHSNHVHCEWD
jgi:hypothetical protein